MAAFVDSHLYLLHARDLVSAIAWTGALDDLAGAEKGDAIGVSVDGGYLDIGRTHQRGGDTAGGALLCMGMVGAPKEGDHCGMVGHSTGAGIGATWVANEPISRAMVAAWIGDI